MFESVSERFISSGVFQLFQSGWLELVSELLVSILLVDFRRKEIFIGCRILVIEDKAFCVCFFGYYNLGKKEEMWVKWMVLRFIYTAIVCLLLVPFLAGPFVLFWIFLVGHYGMGVEVKKLQ